MIDEPNKIYCPELQNPGDITNNYNNCVDSITYVEIPRPIMANDYVAHDVSNFMLERENKYKDLLNF